MAHIMENACSRKEDTRSSLEPKYNQHLIDYQIV